MRKLQELIDFPALIYTEDLAELEECDGPDVVGRCTRAAANGPVACGGKWLRARGWNLKVDAAARRCPLSTLGIVRLPAQN